MIKVRRRKIVECEYRLNDKAKLSSSSFYLLLPLCIRRCFFISFSFLFLLLLMPLLPLLFILIFFFIHRMNRKSTGHSDAVNGYILPKNADSLAIISQQPHHHHASRKRCNSSSSSASSSSSCSNLSFYSSSFHLYSLITQNTKHTTTLIIALIAFTCYVPSLRNDFVFDDLPAIVNNKDVRSNESIITIFYHDYWGTQINKVSLTLC